MNTQENRTEFIVQGTPEVCLGLVRQYFESEEWPYSNMGDRSFVNKSNFDDHILTAGVSKDVSFLNCFMVLVLSIVTFGLFFIAWMIWTELTFYPEVEVKVTADPIGPDTTRLTVISANPDHAEPVKEWIERELVKRKVARSPGTKRSSQDIPDQIKKLAELRDSGAITDDEFQRQKRRLLKRM